MDLDSIAKFVQSAFYFIGGSVAILTYIKAKNGLLNTVNTEYHKKVIERLSSLSDELYLEFDASSDSIWYKENAVKKVVDQIHEVIVPCRGRLTPEDADKFLMPLSEKESRLSNLAGKYQSDPFLPTVIRNRVVRFFNDRSDAIGEAFSDVLDDYKTGLCNNRYWDTLDENHHWLHNQINTRLYEAGFGVSQVEEEVHSIRLEIQSYFSQFNPLEAQQHNRWMHWLSRHKTKVFKRISPPKQFVEEREDS